MLGDNIFPGPFFFPRLFCACMSQSSRHWLRGYGAGRRGGRAGPAQSARSRTRSNGGSLAAPIAVVGQAWPSAVVPTACCTATARRPHQRRAHPLAALRLTAAGARGRARSCAPPSSSGPQPPPPTQANIAGLGRRARGRWFVCGAPPNAAPRHPRNRRAPGARLVM